MKRLLIATSFMPSLFATKAFANKNKCQMLHSDSITVVGVMQGYTQEVGKYVDITFHTISHRQAYAITEAFHAPCIWIKTDASRV